MDPRDDFELLESWRAEDPRAGTILFGRYFDALFRFFRSKVTEGVDDLVQETFLACVKSRDNFRGHASFRTYVFRVAHSKLYDFLRVKHRANAVDFGVTSVMDLGQSPSQVIARDEEQRLLLDALPRLPLDLQVVLELYYLEKIRGPELAGVLGIPEGTVRSRLRRGREMLRDRVLELAEAPDRVAASFEDLDAWAERVREAAHGLSR
jgi:RNA polymerase sigma-70 factor (ECF subfamily)